MFKNLA